MGNYSDTLFARPSFIEGMARIFDFSRSLSQYNRSGSPMEADKVALLTDWKGIAEDMEQALTALRSEYNSVLLKNG